MRNVSQLVIFLLFFVPWASCSVPPGPKVTVCIVDAKSKAFQCVLEGDNEGSELPFSQGGDLLCASPQETEKFIKACKDHKKVPITQCSISLDGRFTCHVPDGTVFYLDAPQADNFACLSPKDYGRVMERCV